MSSAAAKDDRPHLIVAAGTPPSMRAPDSIRRLSAAEVSELAGAGSQPDSLRTLQQELEYWRGKTAELDGRVFEMRSLLQSGKGFSEIMHTADLLEALMAVCRERYNASSSAVLLKDDLDPNHEFFRVRAFYGLDPYYIDWQGTRDELLMFKVPHDNGLLWQIIHQGEVFSVRDLERRPRFKTAWHRWNLGVLGSDVWVPLMRGAEVIGILTLGDCEDGQQIRETEYTFLQEIAAVAATNVDSTLKYEKNERILANLRTLYDVNQQLANVNDFKKLTIETLSSAVSALNAQKANLMLWNPETERLEIKVVWGAIPTPIRDKINLGLHPTKPFAMGEGVAGAAALGRQCIRINDKHSIEQTSRHTVYCILSAPLMHGDDVMGVITLTNKVYDADAVEPELDMLGRFGPEDEQLLLGLADQAAVNLNKARLYGESITDRMTGLYNTRHFESTLDVALASSASSGRPLTLAITDIDHFKRFNDTHGHKAGDAVLIRTADLLGERVRPGRADRAFRYGGEEFCLLLPDTTAAQAAEVLEEYRQCVQDDALEYDGAQLSVTVSVGIAQFPIHGDDRKALFEAADKALYAAKEGGRNRVVVATEG